MKKSLKIGLLGLLTGATAFAGALSLNAQNTEVVSADSNFTMEMEKGASVRLVGTDEKEYGIKYTAKLASCDTEAKYYVMIIPTGWLTKYNLSASYDANCDYYGTLSAQTEIASRIMTMEATPQYVEDEDCYYFEGSIKTVKYENSFREYFGIAYSEKNGERTYAEFETGENVRSVSQVASAALNDKTENWTTDQKASLKKMVKTAYNASLDSDYTSEETAELPTISATKDELSLLGGDTHQMDTLTGVSALENIGVKVQYTSSSPAQVTVSESGMLSANTVGSGATITATVLGEDYEVAEIAPVENMLVGFDTKDSEDNIVKITKSGYTYLNAESEEVFVSQWQESFEGRNGVVKTVTTNGGQYKQHCIYPLFDKTVEQMQALDFDYISIWIYLDVEGTYTARSYTHVLNEVEGKQWQEIRLTKEDITHAETNKNSYWVQNWGANNAIAKFKTIYAQKDSTVTELFQLLGKERNAAPIPVYIDSISYAKFNGEFNAPTQPVEVFELPDVTMNGNQTTVIVNKGMDPVAVENGKVAFPYAGDYTVAYECAYNGLNYTQEFNFSVARAAMATGVLEDFNDPCTNVGLRAGSVQDGGANVSTWLESHKIGSTTKQGVVKLEIGYNDGKAIFVNFGRTLAELQAINDDSWDYIEFSIGFTQTNVTNPYWISLTSWSQTFGANTGAWRTIKLTKAQIMGMNGTTVKNSYWSYLAGANDGTAIDKFWELHSAEGTGFKLADYTKTPTNLTEEEKENWKLTIYLDEIKLGKNAA